MMENDVLYKISDYDKPKNYHIYIESFFIVKGDSFVVREGFNKSLKCNIHEDLAKQVQSTMYPDCEVKKLIIYIPQDWYGSTSNG